MARLTNALGVLLGKKQIMQDKSVPQEMPKDIPAGMAGVINKDQIKKAAVLAQEYQQHRNISENRIKDNELYMRSRHWDSKTYEKKYPDEPNPTSSQLFNALANKHADFMDNFPEASVLPREKSDAETAERLSSILPVVAERAGFEDAYSQVAWDIQLGVGIYGVFWDSAAENGLGDISIKTIDVMSLIWEPGIPDIQDSRNVFHCEAVDNEILEHKYPILKNHLGKSGLTITEYNTDDKPPTDNKTVVYHWYYKAHNGAKTVLHYCQFVDDVVLFSSENEKNEDGTPAYPDGYYWHGKYPFVLVPMFPPPKGSLIGYGTVDIGKRPQRDIDLLNKAMLQNARLASMPRVAYKEGCGINMDEFFDFTTPGVEITNSSNLNDVIKQLNVQPLDASTLSYHTNRIDELKETTGNRDFSQGSTSGGVTAASAIAALQEAGSKQSRDQIKRMYKGVQDVFYICIELIRQFYTLPRQFRIVGDNGTMDFVDFDNSTIKPQSQPGDMGSDEVTRLPIFDIKVRVHKANPYSRLQQNAQAMEFYSAGFFNPDNSTQALAALKMMDLEGKDEIEKTISENGTLQQQLKQALLLLSQFTGDQRFIGGENQPINSEVTE